MWTLQAGIFGEIAVVICAATFFALLARFLRLPLLMGYLVSGIALVPLASTLVPHLRHIEEIRSLGLAVLLFLVGMELDWHKLRQQFRSTALLSAVQVAGSFTAGILLAELTHLPILTGIYLGLALSFSSTVVVIKLLSEAGDLKSLYGRLAISTLLLQDLLSIGALVFLSDLALGSQFSLPIHLLLLSAKLIGIAGITWTLARSILPVIFRSIAKSPELLFLTSLAWCFSFSLALQPLGFPIEIGAFLAGISLGSLPYSLEVVNRIRSLRDFFLILLFVELGSTLVLPDQSHTLLTLVLVICTIFGRPLLSYTALVLKGYRTRTAFFAAITQAQLSEFSLVIIGIGVSSGHMNAQLASSLSATTIISIIFSTFTFSYRNALYHFFSPVLRLFERGHRHHTDLIQGEIDLDLHDHIVIFGYHRMGYHVLRKVLETKHPVLVVDFDPDVIEHLRSENIPAVYGDVEDEHILDVANIKKAALVISTIPHPEESRYLIKRTHQLNRATKVIVTAHTVGQALAYYQQGADYVLLPYMLGGEHVGELLIHHHQKSLDTFLKHRAEELKLLRTQHHALYYEAEATD